MPKRKKRSSLVYSPESVKTVKKRLRTVNWRRVMTLALSTVAAFAVLEAGISLEAQRSSGFSIVTAVYYVIVTLLGIAVIFLNHGFSKKPFTPDMLRDDLPSDEAERICERLNRQKALSKRLMMVLIPFLFAILLDFVYLFYGDLLSGLFRFLVPND